MQAIDKVKDTIININSMPGGLNVMDAPVHFSQGVAGIFPGILIPILAGVSQYVSVKITTPKNNNAAASQENDMAQSMKMMNTIMPLFSVWICFTLPAGVGLYWVCNSVFRTLMVVIVNRFFNNKDIEELVKENAEKVAERKGKPTLTEKIMTSSASNAQEETKKYQSMSDIAKANRSKKDYTPKNYTLWIKMCL